MVSRNHRYHRRQQPSRPQPPTHSIAHHQATPTAGLPKYKFPTRTARPLPPPPTPPSFTPREHSTQASEASLSSSIYRPPNKMAKVHPNVVVTDRAEQPPSPAPEAEELPTVLTVWRKSLLFNCDGFTVFDAKGDLAFRVDSYDDASRSRRRRAEVVLMDVAGKPLLTVRRKRLSLLGDHCWVIYDGDAAEPKSSKPLLSVRRNVSLRASSGKTLAHVTPMSSAAEAASYMVEGSYGRRACAVRDARGDAVAEVRRKESVGDDVFRLVADPRVGAPLAMGLVIALDEMFAGGRGSSARSLMRRTWSA